VTAFRTPPGRAERLRLQHSLDVAVRGADLLEQKLRILRAEHQRLLQAEGATTNRWREQLREAERWLLSGLLLSGETALEAAALAVGPVDVTTNWTTSMGVRYPSEVSCTMPALSLSAAAPANTALVHAVAAYQQAVRAAADQAAASAAARIIGAEVLSTRQRVRALRRHWIPRLREALAHTELALEQNEHEDAVRRRWASRDPRKSPRPQSW